jgi:hypothetical protein
VPQRPVPGFFTYGLSENGGFEDVEEIPSQAMAQFLGLLRYYRQPRLR